MAPAAGMSRWSTILLIALAAAAIVFLAIYEPLTRSTRERDQALIERSVLPLDPSRVRQIRIVSGESDVVLRRRGNGWQLGEKSKDRASTEEVERLLETASLLQFSDRIDAREVPNDKDWSKFGLRTPKRRIEFEGDRNLTLFLGKDGANEDRLYVRTDLSRDVYLVSDQILRQAFRPAGDFRDRRLTDLSPAQIDRLIIRRPDGEIEFLREARGWRIVRPLNVAADDRKVAFYLNHLLGLRIAEYLADDAGDLSGYGLTEGRNEITFFAEGADRPQTLRLGQGPEGVLFGQFTARDSVYRLPVEAEELLKITPESLRDRRLLPLNLDIVDRIRVTAGKDAFVLQRAGGGWEVVAGTETMPASEAAVQALADALATAEVSQYTPAGGEKIAAAGLDAPQRTVEFFSVLSENTPEAPAGESLVAGVAFGKSEAGRLFARILDSPELVQVDEGILAVIPPDPQAWRAPK
jgi:hypothetical protein